MAGMRIPIVLFPTRDEKSVYRVSEGNSSSWAGFYVAVLDLLSETLGFKAVPFPVSDGGFYGAFNNNGDLLGAAGYLARREAGLCPMGLSNTAQRRKFIDYLYPHIRKVPFYIVYRVHYARSQLGHPRTLTSDSICNLIYVLLGPGIALITGLVVFLVSGVLDNDRRICEHRNLRRLYHVIFQFGFQTAGTIQHQSGRILRASWALFCVVMFASYGALLTSNATAPREYPVITGLEDLLETSGIKVGISPENSFFITAMKKASPGTLYSRLWSLLAQQNQSDPATFDLDKQVHLRRVLEGGYVFIGYVRKMSMSRLAGDAYKDVRFVVLNYQILHMAIPQHAFYKAEMEQVLLSATEGGIIKTAMDQWITPDTHMERSCAEKRSAVDTSRLAFLVSVLSAGVGLAMACLCVERLLHQLRVLQRRNRLRGTQKNGGT